jgi:hypothetical protein
MLLLISNSGNACGHAYCMIILRLEIDHLVQVPGFVGAAVHAIASLDATARQLDRSVGEYAACRRLDVGKPGRGRFHAFNHRFPRLLRYRPMVRSLCLDTRYSVCRFGSALVSRDSRGTPTCGVASGTSMVWPWRRLSSFVNDQGRASVSANDTCSGYLGIWKAR